MSLTQKLQQVPRYVVWVLVGVAAAVLIVVSALGWWGGETPVAPPQGAGEG